MIVSFKESGQAQQKVDSLEDRYSIKEGGVERIPYSSQAALKPQVQTGYCEERQALSRNHVEAVLARRQKWTSPWGGDATFRRSSELRASASLK